MSKTNVSGATGFSAAWLFLDKPNTGETKAAGTAEKAQEQCRGGVWSTWGAVWGDRSTWWLFLRLQHGACAARRQSAQRQRPASLGTVAANVEFVGAEQSCRSAAGWVRGYWHEGVLGRPEAHAQQHGGAAPLAPWLVWPALRRLVHGHLHTGLFIPNAGCLFWEETILLSLFVTCFSSVNWNCNVLLSIIIQLTYYKPIFLLLLLLLSNVIAFCLCVHYLLSLYIYI